MNFTQEKTLDLLFDLATKKGGTHLLLNLTLDAFMKAKRSIHQKENLGEYANGYRYCKAIGHSKELVLKVSRTRSVICFILPCWLLFAMKMKSAVALFLVSTPKD